MNNIICFKTWRLEKFKKKAASKLRPYVYIRNRRTDKERWKAYFDSIKKGELLQFKREGKE